MRIVGKYTDVCVNLYETPQVFFMDTSQSDIKDLSYSTEDNCNDQVDTEGKVKCLLSQLAQNTQIITNASDHTSPSAAWGGYVELRVPIPNDDQLNKQEITFKNYRQPYGLYVSGGSLVA